MNATIKNVIKYFAKSPGRLFLLDALGAAVTAFSLFVIVRNLNSYFGMPKDILVYLSLGALVFCIYSTTCFFILKSNWVPFIRVISMANLLYCILTTALMYIYFNQLTILGLTYFIGEIAVIIALVYIELKVANTL